MRFIYNCLLTLKMTTITENGALSLGTTGDARLNLFFKTVRGIEKERLVELIDASWAVDPLDTMKIMMNWRDCRGGKGDYAGFIDGLAHIAVGNPEWILANLEVIPEYGRFLDIVKLWHATGGDEVRAAIIDYCARVLEKDLRVGDGEGGISLLAKWIPSEKGKWDKGFNRALCRRLYGSGGGRKLARLRKEVLVPLRKKLDLVESHLCEKDYGGVKYEGVPSVAMKRYRKAFGKKDSERFGAFMADVASGKKEIKAGQVYPHDLVRVYLGYGPCPVDPVIEEQWKVIKKQVDESGVFKNSVVVCDVSGSMSGTPMEVAIAFGILGLNKGRVITFSEKPQIVEVGGAGSLFEQVRAIKAMPWGLNTNFQAVMELVLSLDEPIEKIYVFSDMQFDEAFKGGTTNVYTNFEAIPRLGRELPQMIFWNLKGNTGDFPVSSSEKGVIMLSGYSPALLKGVMEGRDINPLDTTLEIIRGPRYDKVAQPAHQRESGATYL